jgi:hypothetical protein
MGRRWFLAALVAGVVAGCAGHTVSLPTGEGEPFPEYAEAWHEATGSCRAVRSLAAELSISGRVGTERLRGRVLAGLSAPDRIRLEAVAPFGAPVFILVASGPAGTLLLPRDNRVLRDQAPSAILSALVGLDLGPDDLLAIFSGCVAPGAEAVGGRLYPSGWARIDLSGGSIAYLRREGPTGWRVRAGSRRALAFDYQDGQGAVPDAVHLRAEGAAGPDADLRVGLSQVALNQRFGAEVFAVRIPADAAPISLKELREAGPLGERR